jgi:hypothetical protein
MPAADQEFVSFDLFYPNLLKKGRPNDNAAAAEVETAKFNNSRLLMLS